MSDQRRMVDIDTPRWRAASDVVRPRRCVLADMGKVYGGLTPLGEGWCAFAQVLAPQVVRGVERCAHAPAPARRRPRPAAIARGGGRAAREARHADDATAAGHGGAAR